MTESIVYHQYLIRVVNTDKNNGDVVHTSYYGPFASYAEADDIADQLIDRYRSQPMRVDGQEVHSDCYVTTMTPLSRVAR